MVLCPALESIQFNQSIQFKKNEKIARWRCSTKISKTKLKTNMHTTVKEIYYISKFAHFKGLRLFSLSSFPEARFIQGATLFRTLKYVNICYILVYSKVDDM